MEAGRELADRSDGRLRLDIRPAGMDGDQDARIMDAIAAGRVDMTYAGSPFAAQDYAPMGVTAAPFAIRDYRHWQHFRDGPLARELAAEYEKASGLVVLGYYYYGLRHINSRQPIRRPEDLAGLRIRVPNAPIYLRMFRTLGATPVPMPYAQTYDALRQGTIAAEENCLETIIDGRFYEAAPYITLTGHIADTGIVVISAKRLAGLPEKDQQLVRDVFARAAARLSERVSADEEADIGKLQDKGVTFITLDRDALAAKLAPLLSGDAFAWSGDLYNRLKAIP